MPPERFWSPGGREFAVGEGVRWERYPGDPLWRITYPILREGEEAGRLFRSEAYGRTRAGEGRWHASVQALRWATCGLGGPKRGGYDVAAFDSAEECLLAWGRSADEILDWRG